jgi:ketol-acid reductoisomerase
MSKMYYDKDVKIDQLKGKTVAVIGYGSQGKAQAMNMRDSGVKVIIGAREDGQSWAKAKSDGFIVHDVLTASQKGDVIHFLAPDTAQPSIYADKIMPALGEGKTLGFSHGFNIHFKTIKPPKYIDIIMVAPKGPGAKVREMYEHNFGVPALFAVHQNHSGKARETALAMAKAIGATRAGVLETTFKDEAESDLIGEQCVLVGGLIELIKSGFEVLVEEGYPPELAYFETLHESKLIMDLIYQSGFQGMLKAVSDTAKYGGLVVGPKIVDRHVKENMKRAAKEVRSGKFAKEWIEEDAKGRPIMNVLAERLRNHKIEEVGKVIRKVVGLEK